MSDKELIDTAIREYVNLQRIKAAKDRQMEIEYQEMVLKARLGSLGVPTEHLELNNKEDEHHA